MRAYGFVLLLASAALSGCVSSGETIQGPSGQALQEAKCSGSPNACLKAAAKECSGPYQVVDSSSNAGGLVADIFPGPVTWYRMTYQCGKSDGRMPTFQFRGQSYTPPPVVVNNSTPQMTTTSCNRFGNNVTCTSY
ncbi:hypothetical protein CN216_14455 [Sinorhizobium meliloti]|nr:hypothetical protein CN216_14455 [Sinorhizobium meliloti]